MAYRGKQISVCILGNDEETKSAIIQRFIMGKTMENYFPPDQNIYTKLFDVDDETINVNIINRKLKIDTAELRHRYFQETDGFIFVIDRSKPEALEEFKIIYSDVMQAKDNDDRDVSMIFAAIHPEQPAENVIQDSQLRDLQNEFACSTVEVSLNTGENVDLLFYSLIKEIIEEQQLHPPKRQETGGSCCTIY